MVRRVTELEIVDNDAIRIGDLYLQARNSFVGSVQRLIECGQALISKRETLEHGQWLPWLAANEQILGFKERAARRMIEAANRSPATDLNEKDALQISRQIWGHVDSQLVQQSISNEHYTPGLYIEAARDVMGEIDLDPASCAKANKIIKAKKFFAETDDGLKHQWMGNIWLNPPYGGIAANFVSKLMDEFAATHVKQAIVLVNAHCTDTIWFQSLWDGILCFTDHRIDFYGDLTRSGSTHGSVFAYFGKNEDGFTKLFSEFGAVVRKV